MTSRRLSRSGSVGVALRPTTGVAHLLAALALALSGGTSVAPAAEPEPAITVHLGLQGDDNADGSRQHPLRTMAAALAKIDAAASAARDVKNWVAHVLVEPGVYSGPRATWKFLPWPPDAPVDARLVVQPYPDAKAGDVVLQAGVSLNDAHLLDGETSVYVVNNAEGESRPSTDAAHAQGAFEFGSRPPDVWEQTHRVRYVNVADLSAVRHFNASATILKDGRLAFRTSDGGPPQGRGLAMSSHSKIGAAIDRDRVTLRGVSFVNFTGWRWASGVIIGSNEVVIEDCAVTNSVKGVSIGDSSHNAIIRRCSIRDVCNGIYVGGFNVTIEDCHITRVKDRFLGAAFVQDDTAIEFYVPALGGTVRRNLTYGYSRGIFIKIQQNPQPILVEQNTFVDGLGFHADYFPNVTVRRNMIGLYAPGLMNDLSSQAIYEHNAFVAFERSDVAHPVVAAQQVLDPHKTFASLDDHDYRLRPDCPIAHPTPLGALAVAPASEVRDRKPPSAAAEAQPLHSEAPQLAQQPFIRANSYGALLHVTLDRPGTVKLEARRAGSDFWITYDAPPAIKKAWHPSTGQELVETRSPIATKHVLGFLFDKPQAGVAVECRLTLGDDAGRERVLPTFHFQASEQSIRELFVCPTGEDAVDRGTRQQPLRTLQAAFDLALPGDTIRLLPGLYDQPARLNRSGVPGAPITVIADQPHQAVLDMGKLHDYGIVLENASDVIIRDLVIRWYNDCGISASRGYNLEFRGLRFVNHFWAEWPSGTGIGLDTCPRAVIDHCTFARMEYGIRLVDSPYATIAHNSSTTNIYAAAWIIRSSRGSRIYNNSFCFAGSFMIRFVEPNDSDFRSLYLDYNNYATNIREQEPGVPVDRVKSELPYIAGIAFSKGIFDWNSNPSYYLHMDEWRKLTGHDRHSIFADPRWVDPQSGRWDLKPDSPNIGAGLDGATIGAFGVAPAQ